VRLVRVGWFAGIRVWIFLFEGVEVVKDIVAGCQIAEVHAEGEGCDVFVDEIKCRENHRLYTG